MRHAASRFLLRWRRSAAAIAWIACAPGCANNTISLWGDTDGAMDGTESRGPDDWGDGGEDGPGATSSNGGVDGSGSPTDPSDPSNPSDPSDPSGPTVTATFTDTGDPPLTFCGDGVLGADEECDGDDLGGETCESLGAFGGDLGCDDDCVFDIQGCSFRPPQCGNGIAEAGEACDGADLGGASCSDVPWAQGSGLACTPACELDATACAVADGAVVISEVFYAPLLVPLAVPGQWFELHNPSPTTAVSLTGCTIDGGSLVQTFSVGNLSIPPGGWVTLGSGTPADLGMVADYTTPPAFILMNDGDVIELSCGGELRDLVQYQGEEPWPPFQAGVSISLRGDRLKPFANDDPAAWCSASGEYAMGHRGTPAAPNDCP